MKSDFRIDLSHFLLHSDMKQFFLSNHSLLGLSVLVSACFCFFCTVYAHLWLRMILELSEGWKYRLSSGRADVLNQTSSWLGRRLEVSTGSHSLSCRSTISASLGDWSYCCDIPWNFHVLVVRAWMLSATPSSTVGLETVGQESVQCPEDCFCSQAALHIGSFAFTNNQTFTVCRHSCFCLWGIQTDCWVRTN